MSRSNKNPPLGIVPKEIAENDYSVKRFLDLLEAIERYRTQGYVPKEEWFEELNQLQYSIYKFTLSGIPVENIKGINLPENLGKVRLDYAYNRLGSILHSYCKAVKAGLGEKFPYEDYSCELPGLLPFLGIYSK